MIRMLALSVLVCPALATSQAAKPARNDDFFGLEKIWDVHLTISEQEWTGMFPEGGATFGFAQQRPKFPYAKARLAIGTHKAIEVGIRFKGHSSFSSSRGTLKRPFKVDFDRFVKGQKFLGLKKISLNNNATDVTQIKEAVGYRAYREAGIPAPRTAFARVYITLVGKTKRAYLGLYTIIEQVDRGLLRRQLKGKGTILKPETQILGYFGEEWNERYDRSYIPKTTVKPEHAAKVVELARLANDRRVAQRSGGGDDAEALEAFAKGVERVMEVDSFLRYVAVTAILRNWDNPLNVAHNVYLVVPDASGKVLWLPWDLNLSMSGGMGFGSRHVLAPARTAFGRSMMRVARFEKAYREHLNELIRGCCSAKSLSKSIRLAGATAKEAIADEERRPEAVTDAGDDPGARRPRFGGARRRLRRSEDLLAFVQRNEKAVLDEISGKTPIPQQRGFSGGFGGGFGARARPDAKTTMLNVLRADGALESGAAISRSQLMKAAAKCFARLDRNRSKAVELTELWKGVKAHLNRPGARQSPFAPGYATLSRQLLKAVDKDGDDELSSKEWRAACQSYFVSWDMNGDGRLQQSEQAPQKSRR